MSARIPDYIKDRLDLEDLTSSLPLLRLVEAEGPLSQPEAAATLGLSKGTCNLHFQRLEHEGLVERIDRIRRGRGRPVIVWDIRRGANFYVTLVFDVPFFQASLVDMGGRVIDQHRESLSGATTRIAVTRRIQAFMKRALATAQARGGRIRQVVGGLPGLLAPDTGAVIRAVNFPALDGLDLQALVAKHYGTPCYAGSLGVVFYHGETESLEADRTAMVIHWDLGVGVVFGRGGGLLVPRSRLEDYPAEIPELGHVRVVRRGRRCHCGRRGCLEAYTGGWALLERLRSKSTTTLAGFVEQVHASHPPAVRVAREGARFLGEHLAWPIQLMGVQRIIGTGPLAPVFDHTLDAFREGLGVTFSAPEIHALNPMASRDPQTHMRRGAYLLARRLFLFPELYRQLPRTPASLNGANP